MILLITHLSYSFEVNYNLLESPYTNLSRHKNEKIAYLKGFIKFLQFIIEEPNE